MASVAARIGLKFQPEVSLGTMDENSIILIATKCLIQWKRGQGLSPNFPFFKFFALGEFFSFLNWKSSWLGRLKVNNATAGGIKSDIVTKLGYLNVISGSICENNVCTSLKNHKNLASKYFFRPYGRFFCCPWLEQLGVLIQSGLRLKPCSCLVDWILSLDLSLVFRKIRWLCPWK